jgi:hypothetical protein
MLDRIRTFSQDHKDVLKSVFGVMRFAEYATRHGEDQRAMTLNKCAKGIRVVFNDKPFQEVSVVHQTTLSQVQVGLELPTIGVSATPKRWTGIGGESDTNLDRVQRGASGLARALMLAHNRERVHVSCE